MYAFKCIKCGKIQYGACEKLSPCCYCGGEIVKMGVYNSTKRNYRKGKLVESQVRKVTT